MDKDIQHLRMLSIAHYVVAALTALLSCFALVYVLLGIVFVFNPPPNQGNVPPAFPALMGTIFIVMGLIYFLAGWAMATGLFVAGRSLERRKRYTLCMVVAAVNCMFFPIGTALGVLSLIVLARPSVKAMFEGQADPDAAWDDAPTAEADDGEST